jgi:FemAB-related protein (PEP-CTERM system-associated)
MVDQTVRIVDATANDKLRWDAFVAAHPEATFFHRYGWSEVLRNAFGHRAHYLLAERAGAVVGVLPLGEIRSLIFGHSLISTPFCVYGGPLANDADALDALLAKACERATQLGVAYLELRNMKRLRPDWPCKDSLYVTFRRAISSNDEENLKAIPRKQRAMVRAGIDAGLTGQVDRDPSRLWDMYSESVRNLGTPVFSKKYFECLSQEFGSDCEIVTVEHEGKPVSSVMSFYFRDEVLPYYGGGTSAARAVKANDFMYWNVMCRAVARGVKLFDYGRSKHDTGSFSFKKHWGFEPAPLYYEYFLVRATDVPNVSPTNPKYKLMINTWQRLPLGVSRVIGPMVSRYLG